MAGRRFHGKYRGTVAVNVDPMGIGRIQAVVPDVTGSRPGAWALPCLPLAGPGLGLFAVPPVGAAVWIEFELGDPTRPVWVGGFWRSADEVPAAARALAQPAGVVVIQAAQGQALVVGDAPGSPDGVALRTADGGLVAVGRDGVVIANGQGAVIEMRGPQTDLHHGALTVV